MKYLPHRINLTTFIAQKDNLQQTRENHTLKVCQITSKMRPSQQLNSATTILLVALLSTFTPSIYAFRSTPSSASSGQHRNHQRTPLKIEPIPKEEVAHRLGLKIDAQTGVASIGSDPNQVYNLHNEHEVICPLTETHQGVLTTYTASNNEDGNFHASTIANSPELVSQAILCGSLAASIRNRCKDGNSLYYLPSVITLVESLTEDVESDLLDAIPNMGEMMFNSAGLETNEILVDLTDMDDASNYGGDEANNNQHIMMFARNTHFDQTSASSDVYLLPNRNNRESKVWKFSMDYKVVTINLSQIKSFGDRDSTTPLRPDVWLKDDCYW